MNITTKITLYTILTIVASVSTLVYIDYAYAQNDDYNPSARDYVPYTENYNIRFTADGNIDYDLLIGTIMPEIFEDKLRFDWGVDIAQEDIVLNRGIQISMYQELSYNCGYVIDYTDNQVYWLEAAINSTDIQYTKIFTEIPTPPGLDIDDPNLRWCFGFLKEEIAEIFLEEKSYLTEDEESKVVAAIKHELRGNPNLGHQEFKVGKFNYDYGENVLAFCGEFQKPMMGLGYFGGAMENGKLNDFHLDSGLSALCAISEDAEIFPVKYSNGPPEPGLEEWKNLRMETVHLKPQSVEKLLERNYMMTENAHNMILEYSTSLDVEFIEYMPDDSNTIFSMDPYHDDTFFKIRLPHNGGNYYMNYSADEWNMDLTDVVILVDGEEVDYKEQPYIRSPDARYPQYFTDYIFKVPAKSDTVNIVLFIENYEPDPDHSDDEWIGYRPMN